MSLEMSYLSLEILLPIGYTREWMLTWENARAIVFSRVDLCVREPEKRMEGARMKEYAGG